MKRLTADWVYLMALWLLLVAGVTLIVFSIVMGVRDIQLREQDLWWLDCACSACQKAKGLR